ncbi:MAG: hypothetical protein JEZ07_05870 [Phycisphaerae bacterium]|nr:hypothetical protein [Phycisphaerae bacterium]
MTKATKLLLSVLLMMTVALFGCGKDDEIDEYDPSQDELLNPEVMFEPAPADLSKIDMNKTLVVQITGSPKTLNPLFQSSLYEMMAGLLIYDGFFNLDNQLQHYINPDVIDMAGLPEEYQKNIYRVVPGSVNFPGYTESEDHKTITIKLREDLKWHPATLLREACKKNPELKDIQWTEQDDNMPVTAHDVVYSWQRILSDKVPAQTIKPTVSEVVECVALDDYTVKFVLKEPIATRLDNVSLSDCIIPKHIFEKGEENWPNLQTGPYYSLLGRYPIGFGPYKFKDWVEQQEFSFERWDNYKGKQVYIKEFKFKIVPDPAMALLQFKTGNIDIIRVMTPKQFVKETRDKKFKTYGYKYTMPEWGYSYFGWNMDGMNNPFFNDKTVRRAMAYAMNRELLNKKKLYNLPGLCSGIYHPTAWMASQDVTPVPYDIEKAKALLDEAGWIVNPKDGWRYKDIEYAIVEKTIVKKDDKGIETESKSKVKHYLLDNQDYVCVKYVVVEKTDTKVNDQEDKAETKSTKKHLLLNDEKYVCNENEEIVETGTEVVLDTGTENRKFEFSLTVPNGTGAASATAVLFQSDLLKIGVDMKLRMLEWSSFMQRCLNHEVQAWQAGWGAGTDPDGSRNLWMTDQYEEGRNYGGYSNPRIDELLEMGKKEFDREKRAKIYAEAHKIIFEDQPYVFLYNTPSLSAVSNKLRGITENYFGVLRGDPGMRGFWFPKEDSE